MLNKTKAFRESLLSGSHTKTAGFVIAVTKIKQFRLDQLCKKNITGLMSCTVGMCTI